MPLLSLAVASQLPRRESFFLSLPAGTVGAYFFPVFRIGKVSPPGTPESIPGAGHRPCPGEENEKEGYGVTMVG